LPEAVRHFRRALEIAEKGAAEAPPATWFQRELGYALCHLAAVLAADRKPAEAEEYQRRGILVFDKLASDFPAGPNFRHDIARAQVDHAALLKQLGQTAEAEKAYRRAVDIFAKLAVDFPATSTFRQSAFDQSIELSRFLVQGGRPLEAQELLGTATAASDKLADNFAGRLVHKRGLVHTHLELARLLKANGKTLEAQRAYDQAVAIQEALEKDFADKTEFRRELANAHLSAADVLREDGRAEESERFYHLAEAHWRQLVAGDPNDVERLRGLASTYHNLGRLLSVQPRKRDAKEAITHAVETCGKLLALSPGDIVARVTKGHGHGYLIGYADTTPEAVEHCRAASALFGGLHAEFPEDPHSWKFLADSQRMLGCWLRQDKKPQEAEQAFRRAIEIYEGFAAKFPTSRDIQKGWAQVYFDLADHLVAEGRVHAAEELFHRAIVHQPEDRSPIAQEHRAHWHRRLGQLLAKDANPQEAVKTIQLGIAIWSELATAHPKSTYYRNELGYDSCLLGDVFYKTGQVSKAMDTWRNALVILEKVVAETNDPHPRGQVGVWQERLGATLAETGQPQEADRIYREALAVWEKLAAETKVPDHRWHLAQTHEGLGYQVFRKVGRLREAERNYREAMPIWEELVAEHPQNADYRRHLSWNYSVSSQWLLELGDHAEAAKIAEKLPSAFLPSDWQGYHRAARFLARCVSLAEKDAKLPEADRKVVAEAYLDRSRELVRQAAARIVENADARNELAWFLATHPEPRLRDSARAVELAKEAVELAPTQGAYWNTLGVAHYRAGDWKAAVAALEESMKLRNGGDGFDWFFLAMGRWQLGDKDEARKWYDRAVAWMDKNQPKDEELRRFRAEAADLLGIAVEVKPVPVGGVLFEKSMPNGEEAFARSR
jgi:tetratricopeptide (TPR) repeat protein